MKKIFYFAICAMALLFASCEQNDLLNSKHRGHEFVDLGLSVKWATCNVGANVPEECGDYFAWGETKPKAKYTWENYKWYNSSYETLTKYNTDPYSGTLDNLTILKKVDDAATANWGGRWRMPTEEECDELLDNCTWTWSSKGGYIVTGPNGNSIFLPAAGYRYDSSREHAGSRGYYQSSSLGLGDPYVALSLDFASTWRGGDGDVTRCCGRTVRPVCP